MAVHRLTTQIDALIDRIVVLQPLAIAEVTAGTVATKQWDYRSQTLPYWVNRPSGLAFVDSGSEWRQSIVSRLIVSHTSGQTVGTDTPQELMWQYLPETLTYFEAIRNTLAPSGYTEIDYINPPGLTIASPQGVPDNVTRNQEIYIEFITVVPFYLVTT